MHHYYHIFIIYPVLFGPTSCEATLGLNNGSMKSVCGDAYNVYASVSSWIRDN